MIEPVEGTYKTTGRADHRSTGLGVSIISMRFPTINRRQIMHKNSHYARISTYIQKVGYTISNSYL